MIRYAIEDINGIQFELTGSGITVLPRNSLEFTSENFRYDTDLISNSFLPGVVKIGDSRLEGRSLEFRIERANPDSDNFRQELNELMLALSTAYYLVELNSTGTSIKRVRINIDGNGINYLVGCLYHKSSENIRIDLLDPYWEEYTEQEQSETLTAGLTLTTSFNNAGYLELYPIIEVTVSTLCSYFEFVVGNDTIRIEDTIFGSTDNTVMTIDNKEGRVTIGSFDRTKSIVEGAGFLSLPVGTSGLQLRAAQNASVKIKYRRRYYV